MAKKKGKENLLSTGLRPDSPRTLGQAGLTPGAWSSIQILWHAWLGAITCVSQIPQEQAAGSEVEIPQSDMGCRHPKGQLCVLCHSAESIGHFYESFILC